MPRDPVPARIRRAVELLAIEPHHRVLEIGCGPGVAVALLAERLTSGRIVALDRSATAIERSRRRAAAPLAAGRVVLRQAALADDPLEDGPFDAAFAVNVNLFWTRPAERELAALARALAPAARLHLVYEGPPRAAGDGSGAAAPRGAPRPRRGADAAAAALRAAGWGEVTVRELAPVVAVSGVRPSPPPR